MEIALEDHDGRTNAPVVCRTFTLEDQNAFAKLSGDFNPLHIDPLTARRTLVGGPVVHGINAMLWALDFWSARVGSRVCLRSLDARFLKPLPVNASLSLVIKGGGNATSAIEIIADHAIAATIEFTWDADVSGVGAEVADAFPEQRQPMEVSAEQMQGLRGQIPLCLAESCAVRLFPHLTRRLHRSQIATLIATTRMVGSECPGLHSLYSELHLADGAEASTRVLDYEVAGFDRRFGLVTIKVSAPGLAGSVKAFLRPKPQQQPTCAEIRRSVGTCEFTGQNALIVGGSRGLGEVIAKILGSGGANVIVTFAHGAGDARRIVDDIVSNGGTAACMKLDVTNPAADNWAQRMPLHWSPTHIYYMASPFIAVGQRGVFRPEVFSRFCVFYVDGLVRTVTRFKSAALRGVFNPSSVFLDEMPPDMGEYVAAKSAGESLCAFLAKNNSGLHFARPRLPRLATDQTSSLGPANRLEPLPIMLDQARKFSLETK